MQLPKYSFGIGDRFAQQGEYQLKAIADAKKLGYPFVPVWNKSYREHSTINSSPEETRAEADNAIKAIQWDRPYFVDADHVNMSNVDSFIDFSDFFTLDVADYIGKEAGNQDIQNFISRHEQYIGKMQIPGIETPFQVSKKLLEEMAKKYLYAIQEAGKLHRYIASKKGNDNFVTEVSMDEVDAPQTPIELFFILSAVAFEKIPAQTIAPKFTGRFNKGVDYVGDLVQFEKEFDEDLCVISYAIRQFNLPETLKLSIHSGSDKFSLYPVIGKLINKHNTGIHIKTAGTTWLEEVTGLALSGEKGLSLAKNIYKQAYDKKEAFCAPYASVIDIKDEKLPVPDDVAEWTSEEFANTLRHVPEHPDFNADFRQLIHVGYKIAASLGNDYLNMIKDNHEIVGQQVYENLLNRHIKRLII